MQGINEIYKSRIANYFFWAGVIATVFVIYGSLVPFSYRAHTFQDSLNLFLHIRYFNLGEASRADWIANAIIYIPVSFAWCGYFAARDRSRIGYGVLISLLVLMAVIIEYLQLFIAPRTVSLNDLMAEVIGIVIGVGIWQGTKVFVLAHLEQFLRTGKISVRAILILYITGYVLVALFPFDFYMSGEELARAFESKGFPLFDLREDQLLGFKRFAIWGAEFLVLFPLGFLYVTHRGPRLPATLGLVSFSLFFLLLLEVAQYFMVSGTSSYWSLISKFIGFYAGVLSAKKWPLKNMHSYKQEIRAIVFLGMFPFVIFVLGLRGVGLTPEGSFEEIRNHLAQISFMPFYYHYFTTEVYALLSLMAQFLLVLPVGILLVLDDWLKRKELHRAWWVLAFWGAGFSLFFEAGGLYWSNLRPDPTNLLIGGVGVIIIYKTVALILISLSSEKQEDDLQDLPDLLSPKKRMSPTGKINLLPGAVALAALFGAVIYIFDYPLSKFLLMVGGIGYGVLLYYRPSWWLIVVAAAIPIMDFYPLSGRFFMTEFDFIILLTLAVKYGSGHVSYRFLQKDVLWALLLGGLALIYFLSTLRVLWPLPDMGPNSFNSYYSVFNALRIIKGFFWAFLLIPVLEYELRKDVLSFIRLSYGMIIGLTIACLVVVLERGLFTGLFNFSSNAYRVTGSFASMHTGGSHIDSYLVTMLPFIAIPFLLKNKISNFIFYGGLLLLVLYTIFVTYSRGPYFIAAGVGILLVSGLVVSSHRKVKKRFIIPMSLGLVSLAGAWIALPMFYETILSNRLENFDKGQQTRLSHWTSTLQDTNVKLADLLFGLGPGSFPRNLYITKTVNAKNIAVHNLVSEGDNTFLSMYSGDNIYTSQFITLNPNEKYRLRFKVRSSGERAGVVLPLCERWITDSFRCDWIGLSIKVPPGEWVEVLWDPLVMPIG